MYTIMEYYFNNTSKEFYTINRTINKSSIYIHPQAGQRCQLSSELE